MQDLKTEIPVKFERLEEHKVEDTRFTKVKIYLMHTGQNYNGSYFTKEVIEDAIPTLANTPILAFLEPNSNGDIDTSDHRMVAEKDSDGEIRYKNKGVPYGVIPENNNAKFETNLCEDNVEREFLVVEGLLWTKWDDVINILDRDVVKHQSMELHEDCSGYFEESTNLFHFTEFKFYGACILGLDYMPAMSDSTIELDFGQDSMEKMNKYVQDKMEQFKVYSSKKEELSKGGEVLKDKLALLKEFSLTKEDIEKAGENFEELTLEELKVKIKELIEKLEGSEEEEVKEESTEESEGGDEEPLEEEVEKELEEELDEELDKEKEELISFDELQANYNELQSEHELLKDKIRELKEFKTEVIEKEREESEAKLFTQYESLSDLKEFDELKEKSKEFDKVEDLEKEFALLFVKHKANIETKEDESSISFNLEDDANDRDNRYGDLFEKYSK